MKNSIIWLILVLFLFNACKTSEKVVIGKVSNIPDVKLRKLLKDNEINYNQLYLKKVGFTLDDGDQKRSFKGSFVIKKDSVIIVSIYALMGIELIRAQLTKDSVIIVDKHNKFVYNTDYSYFENKFGVDITFDIIQSIISNQLFIYPDEGDFYDGLKKYKHDITKDFYAFKSIKGKRVNRIAKRDNSNIIYHEIDIYPELFKIFNVFLKDFGTGQSLKVKYDNFKNFNNILFPEDIVISATQGVKEINLSLKINYLDINDGGSLHFKIPTSYQNKDI